MSDSDKNWFRAEPSPAGGTRCLDRFKQEEDIDTDSDGYGWLHISRLTINPEGQICFQSTLRTTRASEYASISIAASGQETSRYGERSFLILEIANIPIVFFSG
jgi:hypothetical protein